MTTPHDDEHERTLARVLSRELEATSDQVRSLAASCPTCRRELEELEPVARALEAYGATERRLLAEAVASIDDEDRRTARRHLPRTRRRASTALRWGLALAVAASLAVVTLWWRRDRPVERPDPHFLGADPPAAAELLDASDPRCLTPRGRVGGYDEFVWDWERAPGETFTLVVSNVGEAGAAVRVSRLDRSVWVPTPDEKASLGDEIRWEVRKLGPTGELVDVAQAFAWRSRSR